MASSPDRIKDLIPAKFHMLSGSEDQQTSADVGNVGTFELPNPSGKAGGACTSALLKVLNEHRGPPVSWMELLRKMRGILQQKGFSQVPQLSSSRMMDVNQKFEIVPPESNGARRAILIGINYVGTYSKYRIVLDGVRTVLDQFFTDSQIILPMRLSFLL
jgi:hypothetical protein